MSIESQLCCEKIDWSGYKFSKSLILIDICQTQKRIHDFDAGICIFGYRHSAYTSQEFELKAVIETAS
jgi:hypothetical protein